MKIACPQCQKKMQVADHAAGAVVNCPACQGQFVVPAAPMKPMVAPLPPRPPMAIAERPSNPFAFDEEDLKEEVQHYRERRAEERAERQDRSHLRQMNALGVTSMSIGIVTSLMLLSGAMVSKSLPFYTGTLAFLSTPTSLAGLVTGIIGLLRPGRPKLTAAIGTGVCAFVILILIPLVWLDLAQPPTTGNKK